MKWNVQPKRRSRSWARTIVEQRAQISQVLEDSPSLRSRLPEYLLRAYPFAVAMASKATNLPSQHFPAQCPYALEQLFDENFFGEENRA